MQWNLYCATCARRGYLSELSCLVPVSQRNEDAYLQNRDEAPSCLWSCQRATQQIENSMQELQVILSVIVSFWGTG
jgi:hypothetical protein